MKSRRSFSTDSEISKWDEISWLTEPDGLNREWHIAPLSGHLNIIPDQLSIEGIITDSLIDPLLTPTTTTAFSQSSKRMGISMSCSRELLWYALADTIWNTHDIIFPQEFGLHLWCMTPHPKRLKTTTIFLWETQLYISNWYIGSHSSSSLPNNHRYGPADYSFSFLSASQRLMENTGWWCLSNTIDSAVIVSG